jgi:DNA ligase D-like protein (predicted 3'-phosphoesterase)
MEGVLKSWAVPKGTQPRPRGQAAGHDDRGPSIDYGDFEGIIPEGQYGGGTVVLWDQGTWEPLENPHEGLRKGALKFLLDGKKLKGKWTLVRIKGKDPREEGKTWLLIKERDELVRSSKVYSITEDRPESLTTGRTLEQIAGRPRPGLELEPGHGGGAARGFGPGLARREDQDGTGGDAPIRRPRDGISRRRPPRSPARARRRCPRTSGPARDPRRRARKARSGCTR